MKVFLKIISAIIIIFALVIGGGFFFLTRGLETGRQLEISNIDLSSAENGTYEGKYSSGRWTNELSITVKDHKITKIDVIKDVAVPKPEWTKQLFDTVIQKQGTNVDVISGATVTSKAYLKSIENAFGNGDKQ